MRRPLPALTLAAALAALAAAPAPAPAAISTKLVSKTSYGAGIVVRHERVTIDGQTADVFTTTMPLARPSQGRVLEPVLPGNVVSQGTQTTSAVTRELSRYGTAVAINADLFEYATGQPSGLLVIDGDVFNQPQGGRPALTVDTAGKIGVTRPRASGTLKLPGGRTLPFQVNVRASNGIVSYDSGWGKRTPAGVARSLLGVARTGTIVHKGVNWLGSAELETRATRAGAMTIPPSGTFRTVFSAYGKRAAAALAKARKGSTIDVRYRLGPLPTDIWSAVGGGPILVRGGKIVYQRSANREFSDAQLVPRDARTAVAQLADGRVIFYVVDRPGFSVAQVARDLHHRGARTAMAFDSGGSTAVSVNGKLLNEPADGVERAVGNTLVYYAGDPKRSAIASVQVDGSNAGAVPRLGFTMARPATVEVVVVDPDRRVHVLGRSVAKVGTHPIQIPHAIAKPGTWTLEVVADTAHAHEIRRFRITEAAAADTASANAPADATPADAAKPAAKPAAAASDDSGSSALAWILGAVAVLAIAGLLALVALRRRRRAG